MTVVVLDASAALAAAFGEAGGEAAESEMRDAVMSSVNWAEVLQRCLRVGVPAAQAAADFQASGLRVVPFDGADARAVAEMEAATREAGLSLADRACLALAARLGAPALTVDRAWAGLRVGVEVRVLRA